MMQDLITWLDSQNSSLGTHRAFRRRARELATEHVDRAALLYLLAGLSRRFEVFFDDVPLPSDAAAEAKRRLRLLLEAASSVESSTTEVHLTFLNRIARANLLIDSPLWADEQKEVKSS